MLACVYYFLLITSKNEIIIHNIQNRAYRTSKEQPNNKCSEISFILVQSRQLYRFLRRSSNSTFMKSPKRKLFSIIIIIIINLV